jgi:TetR/AcrR family transcriptional regulator, mexJK operon transcriptional repressor
VATTQPAEGTRSARKRQAILTAALEVFLEHGFVGAGMDQVAAAAGVSKVTVYHHFADKQRLFVAVIKEAISDAEAGSRDLVEGLATSTDLTRDLSRFARRHVAVVTKPHLVRLRRLIVAESGRFPELARAWHAAGPERGHATLAEQISTLTERGLLQAPDPLLAAQHLNYLILSVPLNEALFTGRDAAFPARRLNKWADEAVRVFLAAYAA